MEFNSNDFARYVVTGVTVDGKRFKRVTDNPYYALGINLYRGSLWGIPVSGGPRRLLRRVWN